jgi:RNA polymerase sigma factor (sigma-70 family)
MTSGAPPGQCRLDLCATFYLDHSVPADDEATSLNAIGPAAAGQHGAVAFATTHWSVVLTAQGESPAAHEALEKLCRTYWRPIFAFLRRQGIRPEEAEDLTQGFFVQLLERRSLSAVRQEKGRLRSYLLGALKYFLADEQRRAMAIKRGKGQRLIPLEELRADGRIEMEPADPVTAEMIYERRWALTVLEQVLDRLKNEYRTAGKAALFDSLKQLLPDEPGSPSQAEIAARLGMAENAIRQAFYRFRQRYQSLLREEIAHTVATPGDIEDELRHLIAVLEA